MRSLGRWKRCVVNVEFGQFNSEAQHRQSGTAIFVKYKEKFFLITAAHLIIDTNIGSNKPIYHQLYKEMFRVPQLTEFEDENKRKIMTKNLYFNEEGQIYIQKTRNGIPFQHEGKDIVSPKFIELSESSESEDSAVTISQENDLAVISLRGRLTEGILKVLMNEPIFVEELLLLDYLPITIDEIGTEPSREGADIFTVGYPAHISQVEKRDDIIGNYEKFFSVDITQPCFTFGKVSMLTPNLSYFWGDLRVYIGNSGCPVIEDEKLVGIVTHDAVIENNTKLNNVPFAKATKAKYIFNLLDEQLKKDAAFLDPATLHIRFPNIFASPEEKAKIEKMLEVMKKRTENIANQNEISKKKYLMDYFLVYPSYTQLERKTNQS